MPDLFDTTPDPVKLHDPEQTIEGTVSIFAGDASATLYRFRLYVDRARKWRETRNPATGRFDPPGFAFGLYTTDEPPTAVTSSARVVSAWSVVRERREVRAVLADRLVEGGA